MGEEIKVSSVTSSDSVGSAAAGPGMLDKVFERGRVREKLLKEVREHLVSLTAQERLDFISDCMSGYCRECGRDHVPCCCMRDE